MKLPALRQKLVLAAASLSILAAPAQLSAQSLTWNFAGNGGYGTIGNSLEFTQDGFSVTATAWGYTKGSSNNAFEEARLNQYSPTGLGVSNVHESSSSPYHQLDNSSHNDWVLFLFDSLVSIESIKIQPSPGPFDRDVSYWAGNVAPNIDLDGVTYAGLGALGFLAEQTDLSSSSSSARFVPISTPATGVNALLFGPKKGVTSHHGVDAFKIASLSATVIPEPSAALLALIGIVALFGRRRR